MRHVRSTLSCHRAFRLRKGDECAALRCPVRSGVEDGPAVDRVRKPRQPPDVVGHRIVGRPCALDLEEPQATARLHGQVGLDARLVSHVVERGRQALVEAGLQGFHHDHVLEKSAAQWVTQNLLRRIDLQQMRRQPHVREIDLRRLHEPLAEVVVVGLKAEDDEARLQDGHPFLERRRADPHVARKPVEADDLSDAAGEKPHEQLELPLMRQIDELPHVAFDIRAVIGLIGVRGILLAVVDGGQEAAIDVVVAIQRNPRLVQLRDGEGVERQDGGAPGKGLRNALLQPRLVRAGEDVLAVLALLVDGGLDLAQQLGNALDLVNDGRCGKLRQKALRVAFGEVSDGELLKIGVGVTGERHLGESGLAALSRAFNRHDGERGGQLFEFSFNASGNHDVSNLGDSIAHLSPNLNCDFGFVLRVPSDICGEI